MILFWLFGIVPLREWNGNLERVVLAYCVEKSLRKFDECPSHITTSQFGLQQAISILAIGRGSPKLVDNAELLLFNTIGRQRSLTTARFGTFKLLHRLINLQPRRPYLSPLPPPAPLCRRVAGRLSTGYGWRHRVGESRRW